MVTEKLMRGRFDSGTNATVEAFSASEHFDRRLAHYDIAGSRAHALMLNAVGVISDTDIKYGLADIGVTVNMEDVRLFVKRFDRD